MCCSPGEPDPGHPGHGRVVRVPRDARAVHLVGGRLHPGVRRDGRVVLRGGARHPGPDPGDQVGPGAHRCRRKQSRLGHESETGESLGRSICAAPAPRLFRPRERKSLLYQQNHLLK